MFCSQIFGLPSESRMYEEEGVQHAGTLADKSGKNNSARIWIKVHTDIRVIIVSHLHILDWFFPLKQSIIIIYSQLKCYSDKFHPMLCVCSSIKWTKRDVWKHDIRQLDSVIILSSCDTGDDYSISISRNPFFWVTGSVMQTEISSVCTWWIQKSCSVSCLLFWYKITLILCFRSLLKKSVKGSKVKCGELLPFDLLDLSQF